MNLILPALLVGSAIAAPEPPRIIRPAAPAIIRRETLISDPVLAMLMMAKMGGMLVGGSQEAGPDVSTLFKAQAYSGNGGTQTILSGLNFSGSGGLVWLKRRDAAASHYWFDTVRGEDVALSSNLTSAEGGGYDNFFNFLSSGASIVSGVGINDSGQTYAGWGFIKGSRFFDVVSFTGGTNNNRRISHNLGVEPGFVLVKNRGSGAWYAYHRSFGRGYYIEFAFHGAATANANSWGTSDPTTTDFGIAETIFGLNGASCIAYLFAHDPAANGIIQCGAYTGNGSSTGPSITLGWQPQYLLIKNLSTSNLNWSIFDTARGLDTTTENVLQSNTTGAENDVIGPLNLGIDTTATGFDVKTSIDTLNKSGDTIAYIAIRAAS